MGLTKTLPLSTHKILLTLKIICPDVPKFCTLCHFQHERWKREKVGVFCTDYFPRWLPYSHTILDPVQCMKRGCSRLGRLFRNVRQERAFQLVQNVLNAAVFKTNPFSHTCILGLRTQAGFAEIFPVSLTRTLPVESTSFSVSLIPISHSQIHKSNEYHL